MRRLFVMLATLLAFTANANPIRVVGVGVDIESARNNGFSNAIDIYVGTVVVSERELHNYKLTKNEILVYSSGYVDNYKIISQTNIGNQLQLVMDVSVNTNRISNRILGKYTTNESVDGVRIQSQVGTYQTERNNADRLLNNALNDYPYRAYNIEQLPYHITTTNRILQFVMPYKLSWNYNYLMAISDILEKTQDAKSTFLNRAFSNLTISAKDNKDHVFGKRVTYSFNDITQPQLVVGKLYDDELRIMARLMNKSNDTVWYICHHPYFLSGKTPAFYSVGDIRNITLHGNAIEQGEVKLDIGPDLNRILKDIHRIQLQIVKSKDC